MSETDTCQCYLNPTLFSATYPQFAFIEKSEKIGINEEEKYILECLSNAWNAFIKLPDKHRDHNNEFKDAIHRAQSLIAMQVARRVNPEIWWVPAEHSENS